MSMCSILICGVLFCLLAVTAESENDNLWTSGTSHGIELLWSIPTDMPLPIHYTIRRTKSGRNNWIDIGSTTLDTTHLPNHLRELVVAAMSYDRHKYVPALAQLRRYFYRDPRFISVLLGTYFHDTTTTPLQEYDYQVWTPLSLLVVASNVESHQRSIPSPPIGLSSRRRGKCIEMWWNTDSALYYGIWGFIVYRSSARSGAVRLVQKLLPIDLLEQDTLLSGFIRDCSIHPGEQYTYNVSACNVFGHEGQPNQLRYIEIETTTPPSPPRLTNQIEMNNLTASLQRSGNDSIVLLIRPSNTKRRYAIHTLSPGENATTKELQESGAEAIAVTACTHNSSMSSTWCIPLCMPLPDTTAPPCPDYVELHQLHNYRKLQWLPITCKDIAGYIVQERRDNLIIERFLPSSLTSYIDSVQAAVSYRVTAVDVQGNISKSCIWTSAHTIEDIRTCLNNILELPGGIRLQWDVPPNTAKIFINRYDGDSLTTPVTIAQLPGHERSFIDRSADATKSIWYEIVVQDSANRLSMPSNRRGITRQRLCITPRIDSLSYRDGTVVLFWDAPLDDNLVLERLRTDREEIVILARIMRGETMFIDDQIEPGVTYSYRIRCIGQRSIEAEASTITIPP